jgi:hypothetical protein
VDYANRITRTVSVPLLRECGTHFPVIRTLLALTRALPALMRYHVAPFCGHSYP